jgi:hypothetical protein
MRESNVETKRQIMSILKNNIKALKKEIKGME